MNKNIIEEKHTLVIGGAKGIGNSITKILSQAGHRVTTLGRSGGDYQVDITTDHINQTIKDIIKEKGNINNVIFCQRFRGKREDSWGGEFNVSLSATQNMIEQLNHLNSIVIISSAAVKFIAKEQPLSYHIGKSGLEQMVRYYAVKLGKLGTRVNAIAPITVLKEESKDFYQKNSQIYELYKKIIPLGRMCTPEDIAYLAEFLCSSKADFITGQIITLDGGLTLQGHESMARELSGINNAGVKNEL